MKYLKENSRRYELKYLIRADLVKKVTGYLSVYLDMDRNCQKRKNHNYTVRSIYFDSPGFKCFHEKLGGQRDREKFRLRTYGEAWSAPVFLENKLKNGQAYVKNRVKICDGVDCLATNLSNISGENGNSPLLDRFLFHLYGKLYLPSALVIYERKAYVHPSEETIRVTLDSNLRAGLFPNLNQMYDEDALDYLLFNWVIVEIKFTHLMPGWLKDFTSFFALSRMTCSKYCTSVGHFLGKNPGLKDGLANVSAN